MVEKYFAKPHLELAKWQGTRSQFAQVRGGRMLSGEVSIRVRYAETDRMGLLHHANYLVYFEQGRTELLRAQGLSYRDMEDQGFLLVLTKVAVRYRQPARYDDLLTLRTTVERTTLVKIEHRYDLL